MTEEIKRQEAVDTFLFASESVGEGHPDKLCDQVSDAIVDACIRVDPDAILGLETVTRSNNMILIGEASTREDVPIVDYESVARQTCIECGFNSEASGLDGANCIMTQIVVRQDANITAAVRGDKPVEDWGAGDQGLIFGYATDEWDSEVLHPYSHYLANKICEKMAEIRKSGQLPWLRPDCKSQVVLEYQKDQSTGKLTPLRAHNVLVSTQHDPSVTNEEISEQVTSLVIKQVIPESMLQDTRIIVNPTGKFDVGGPAADAGLTGRKIIVDTYGGWAPHGGGAFSGKDPSKTDRSAGYFTRYVAKSLVAAGLAHRALVQVAYAIGLAEPMSIHVDSHGSARHGLTDSDLLRIVKENFSFRPGHIIQELQLKRPMYQQTASFGAFGREPSADSFPWEKPKNLSHITAALASTD